MSLSRTGFACKMRGHDMVEMSKQDSRQAGRQVSAWRHGGRYASR